MKKKTFRIFIAILNHKKGRTFAKEVLMNLHVSCSQVTRDGMRGNVTRNTIALYILFNDSLDSIAIVTTITSISKQGRLLVRL